ncbi:histidine kinase [Arenibacter sp. 6A1]|uniref:sensor histidine kinase n=1 Tax=Arenibacter sp. 6A1 TaxID=2720391 RepID=UPI0014485266|nr:histidine kinase [Arenibacter sp. 6A1]NKI28352.1 histidine kinase [Arenibacter sp. 6A1]
MKRNIISTLLLILVIIAIPIIIATSYSNKYDPYNEVFPDLPTDEKWEYVKERLFDGETPNVPKLKGPILFTLENATKQDSVMVKNAMQRIRAIIPNKEIDFYERFLGKSPVELANYMAEKIKSSESSYNDFYKGFRYFHIIQSTINLGFNTDTLKVLPGVLPDYQHYPAGELSTVIRKTSKSGEYSNLVGADNIHFSIEKNELEDDYLQSLITAHIMKSLCKIQNSRRNIKQVPSVYGQTNNSSFSTIITKNDEFLLQKLYAPNFMEEFKEYLFKTYPWYYALNFIDKKLAETYATWTIVFLGIFFLIIGFNLHNKEYNIRYFKYFIPTIILLLWLISSMAIYNYLTHKHQYALDIYSIRFIIITIVAGSLIALLLFLFDKYVINEKMSFTLALLLKVIFTYIVLLSPIFISLVINAGEINWDFSFRNGFPVLTVAIGRGIFIYLNHFSENLIREKDLELSRLKEVNAQAEVKLLQSQINPHFLYNALNSIASLAHKNADKTEKMALSLSDLFKYTINRKGKKDSTIGDEVEMVKNYLEVEQIRFDDRLNFTIEVDPSLENTKIPMFLIQPLIENAVKHGISKLESKGQITLRIQKSEAAITIIVKDNGPDFPEGLVSGHGLQTVFDLLRLTYKEKASISWKNTPAKQIKITIEN